jgi:L-2,4-diaminobutyrate decarboxylase
VVIGQTVCNGNVCLKFTLLNPTLTPAKLDELLDLILSLR